MMTSSNGIFSTLLALCEVNPPITGGFPSQRPVARSFNIFFGLRLNKWLSKQWRRRWFETPSRSLWIHCNDYSSTSEATPKNMGKWITLFSIRTLGYTIRWHYRHNEHELQLERKLNRGIMDWLLSNLPRLWTVGWAICQTTLASTTLLTWYVLNLFEETNQSILAFSTFLDMSYWPYVSGIQQWADSLESH